MVGTQEKRLHRLTILLSAVFASSCSAGMAGDSAEAFDGDLARDENEKGSATSAAPPVLPHAWAASYFFFLKAWMAALLSLFSARTFFAA